LLKDLKLEIKYKPINSIIGYVNNTRLHPQNQIDQIKSSIIEFGMCTPIGIHNDTIVYGHGRHEALKQLGYDEVPTLDLSHLTEAQRKAFTIADNKIGDNSSFDEDLLQLELMALDEMNFDYSKLGFDFDIDIEQLEDEEFEVNLPSGDREPIRNMTFTVSDEQHELIEEVLKLAKEYPLQDPAGINENSNGNALYYICEVFKNGLDS
jgi:hypothetical protein